MRSNYTGLGSIKTLETHFSKMILIREHKVVRMLDLKGKKQTNIPQMECLGIVTENMNTQKKQS